MAYYRLKVWEKNNKKNSWEETTYSNGFSNTLSHQFMDKPHLDYKVIQVY